MTQIPLKRPRMRLDPHSYKELCQRVIGAGQLEVSSLWFNKPYRFTTSNSAVSRDRMKTPT